MALNWQWSDKIGKLYYENEKRGGKFEFDIYKGNAPMIFIHNYEENGEKYYNLFSFFCDAQHLNNCVKAEIFEGWKKIELYTSDTKILNMALKLYKAGVEIELLHAPF